MIADFTKYMLAFRRNKQPTVEAARDGIVVGFGEAKNAVLWPAPSAEHASHATVLAASGAGKTMLICKVLAEEFCQPTDDETKRPSMLLVDPKGDLGEVVRGVAAHAPDNLCRISYLNPFDGGFPFNLTKLNRGKTPSDILALQLASLVAEVSTATGAQKHLGVGARQLDVLTNVLLASLEATDPRASVLWALDALTTNDGMKLLASITKSERAKQFLLSANLGDELRASCASRLRSAFAASQNLERIVAADAILSFEELLAPGQMCILDLGQPTGGLSSLQFFWSNLVVRLVVEFLLERPSPWQGHHTRIVIDEAQIPAVVLADCAERILTTGRSRGISLVTLSQGTVLLKDASETLLRVLLTNTPNRYIGRLSAADAELLGREVTAGPGVDESVSAIRSRFVSAVTNLNDREFFLLRPGKRERFRSADVPVEAWKQAGEEHADAIAKMKAAHALTTNTPRVALADIANNDRKPSPRKARPKTRWG